MGFRRFVALSGGLMCGQRRVSVSGVFEAAKAPELPSRVAGLGSRLRFCVSLDWVDADGSPGWKDWRFEGLERFWSELFGTLAVEWPEGFRGRFSVVIGSAPVLMVEARREGGAWRLEWGEGINL